MILLISQHTVEATTDLIQDWIERLGGDVLRVNGGDLIQDEAFSLYLSGEEERISLRGIDFDRVNILWFRRWMQGGLYDLIGWKEGRSDLHNYVKQEFQGLSAYFLQLLKDKKWLDKHPIVSPVPSKAEQLRHAIRVGMNVPETLITSQKAQVEQFLEKHGKIIVKNLSEIQGFRIKGLSKSTYTALIAQKELKKLKSVFFPSLFQQFIPKEAEIRVFYFLGRVFPMAIFSSANQQTVIDFRRYDTDKPNRNVPFLLPKEIEKKIDRLMKRLKLNTGSLDLILSEDGRLYFLEVNPHGQFGMVSFPCNYYVERERWLDISFQWTNPAMSMKKDRKLPATLSFLKGAKPWSMKLAKSKRHRTEGMLCHPFFKPISKFRVESLKEEGDE